MAKQPRESPALPGRTGLWLVGAYGAVASCARAGLAALRHGLTDKTGLVTETEALAGLDLVPWPRWVLGGHDVRRGDCVRAVEDFHRLSGIVPLEWRKALQKDFESDSARVRPGVAWDSECDWSQTGTLAEQAAALQKDWGDFRRTEGLDALVVVYLGTAEPDVAEPEALRSPEQLEALIVRNRRERIQPSVLYAYAALSAGIPFVNFTSSRGSSLEAFEGLSRARGVPHMGRDGKTGETLLKTVLAPMFVARNLDVLSWEGHNILGNPDGRALADPGRAEQKLAHKDAALRKILKSRTTHSRVRIDYVPSLGDWKTAWDHIHFAGFLGTKMTMQFTWQGCDSALAAPLVLDLGRLAERAMRHGESGGMPWLACFFKDPWGVEEQGFAEQLGLLHRYAAGAAVRTTRPAKPAQTSRMGRSEP